MKLILTILLLAILLISPTFVSAQTYVEFQWTQPDSTAGNPDQGIPPQATPPGSIIRYEIFKATPADTTYYGDVVAPANLSDMVVASVEVELYEGSSIRVRAVDIRGQRGTFSLWSEAITVEPGAPGETSQPDPVRVYFGG